MLERQQQAVQLISKLGTRREVEPRRERLTEQYISMDDGLSE